MFELLLMTGGGGNRPILLDSGPGPQQLLFGDQNLGFFGEVAASDVLTSTALATQISDLAAYSQINAGDPWLKFVYNGKYLFIAKRPLFNTLTWNKLYAAGLVYGTDDAGTFNNGAPTNQIRLASTGPYRFKIRTLTSDASDPTTLAYIAAGSYSTDISPYRASMWTDLLYRVCSRGMGSAYPSDKWAAYTDSQITSGSEVLRESVSSDTTKYVIRPGLGGDIRTYTMNTKVSSASWRPVLELVGASELFKPQINDLEVGDINKAFASASVNPVDASSVQRLTAFVPQTTAASSVGSAAIVPVVDLTRLTVIVPQSAGNPQAPSSPTITFNA
jgi:hypothetical protein